MFQIDSRYTGTIPPDGRTRATTDEQFAQIYNEQGIQPSYKKSSAKKRRERDEQSEEDLESNVLNQDASQPTKKYRERLQEETENDFEYLDASYDPAYNQYSVESSEYQQRSNLSRTTSTSIINIPSGFDVAIRARVSSVNVWVIAWGMWLWITFQLPFAIFTLVAFGLIAVLQVTVAAINETWLGSLAISLATTVASLLSSITSALGLDFFSNIDPSALFLLCALVTMLIGMITLLFVVLTYALNLFSVFGGRGSTLKAGTLLLCLIGYALPLLNLFPWFLCYSLVIWRYPK
jgi:cation transport ATPase